MSTISVDTDVEDIKSLVRVIVREEIQKILPNLQGYNSEPESQIDVASIVREEVLEALAPLTRTVPDRRIPPRRTAIGSTQPRRATRDSNVPQRKTELWRTDDNVPVCFHCGRPGHVLRYCRERRQIFSDARAARTSNSRRDVDSESLQSFDGGPSTSARFRSNSPYPRRPLRRRQSLSPTRRPSPSPRRSNEEN